MLLIESKNRDENYFIASPDIAAVYRREPNIYDSYYKAQEFYDSVKIDSYLQIFR
jgi:hypothetical protein